MTRERMRHILAEEVEKTAHPEHTKYIKEIRDGTHGPGIEAALTAMERAVQEALAEQLK